MKKILLLNIVLLCVLFLGISHGQQSDVPSSNGNNNCVTCPSVGIVTDAANSSIYLLDPVSNGLFGPYLGGELGAGDSRLKAVITPDGKESIVINPNSQSVYFIQMTRNLDESPTLKDVMNIGYEAQNIILTPDGKRALINIGGNGPMIALLDVKKRAIRQSYLLKPTESVSHLEISIDGKTVVATDEVFNQVHVFKLESDGTLTMTASFGLSFQPGNLSISADGKMAIVVNKDGNNPAVLTLDAVAGPTLLENQKKLLQGSGLDVAASNIGNKVLYLGKYNDELYFHHLNFAIPGEILSSTKVETIYFAPRLAANKVESLTFGPGGRYAYVLTSVSGSHSDLSIMDTATHRKINSLLLPDSTANSIIFGNLPAPTTSDNGKPNTGTLPFGDFETPQNGASVAGSIAVTGWALDESGIASVKLYRESGNSLSFIGDAVFVEGARPDVAAAYPGYPDNTRAGWGYMLLTHFLPKGDSQYRLHAIATDTSGQQVTLGIKTIHVKNASSQKPFGAIDSPGPGDVVSGTHRIQGWALAAKPNTIPKDGSTIKVYVDNQYKGTCKYDIYRADIAGSFPGYSNSSGALAYFDLDTAKLSEGQHTLQWTVTDDAGNTDGIGSRYFSVGGTESTKPSVGITSPENDGSISVNNGTINISGIVGEGSTLSWQLNNKNKGSISHDNGMWILKNISLANGKNTITVIAAAGTETRRDTLFVYRNSLVKFAGPLRLSENLLEIGKTTSVDFSILVDSATTGLTKMQLISVDKDGNQIKVLTSMNDDGVSPDDIPNDNVFSCRVYISENSSQDNYYQAQAFKGAQSGNSELRTIVFLKPLTAAEIAEDHNFAMEAKKHEGSVDQLATWLALQPGISGIEKNYYKVSWLSKHGISYTTLFRNQDGENAEDGGFVRNQTRKSKDDLNRVNYKPYNAISLTTDAGTFNSTNQIGNNKILIWSPYYTENSSDSGWNYEDTVYSSFKNHSQGFQVTYQKNYAASVDSVKDWGSYGAVIVHTHGSENKLATGTIANSTLDYKYRIRLKDKQMGYVATAKNPTLRYGITPRYINARIASFPNTFFYLGACHSGEGNFYAQLLKKGGGAVVGYVNSIKKSYNKKFADLLISELLDGSTLGEAFAAGRKKYGKYDRTKWEAVQMFSFRAYGTSSPANSDLVLTATGFINGDFETGDHRGWDSGSTGDVRVLQAIGPINRPQGSYMAVLSTGLGAINSSTSILEQTFTVPDDAKSISFTYDWVSEEPREWLGSSFNDKMAIEWISGGTTIKIVEKDINSPTWIPSGNTGLGNLFSGGDGTAFHTGWKTKSFDISPYQGKQVTFRIRVWDVGDSAYDSACFIDQVTIQ